MGCFFCVRFLISYARRRLILSCERSVKPLQSGFQVNRNEALLEVQLALNEIAQDEQTAHDGAQHTRQLPSAMSSRRKGQRRFNRRRDLFGLFDLKLSYRTCSSIWLGEQIPSR